MAPVMRRCAWFWTLLIWSKVDVEAVAHAEIPYSTTGQILPVQFLQDALSAPLYHRSNSACVVSSGCVISSPLPQGSFFRMRYQLPLRQGSFFRVRYQLPSTTG